MSRCELCGMKDEDWQEISLGIASLKAQLSLANKRLEILEPLNHQRRKEIVGLRRQLQAQDKT